VTWFFAAITEWWVNTVFPRLLSLPRFICISKGVHGQHVRSALSGLKVLKGVHHERKGNATNGEKGKC
jgi:hypothetical protein